MSTGFRAGLAIPLGAGSSAGITALGFRGLPWFQAGTSGTVVPPVTLPPGMGGWEWLNNLNPPRQRDPEDEPRQAKRKKRRKLKEPEEIVLAPDLTVETGIVETVPAWDALGRLQEASDEAERVRRKKLRMIALADDDWLMMN